MKQILFDRVSKSFDGERAAVHRVSFEVPAGSLVVLLGPSGCGKTTLLKMVNRLVEPTSGRICMDETDIRSLEVTALRRQIGYVIQQVGLFPHMTVGENIGVVPQLNGWKREQIAARVAELLELVHLPPEFASRYPSQLSGGQQQRVGLARALAADPGVLLMDEPFGAIDAITRASLQDQLIELQQRLLKTVLFVTHDVDEALRLADRIAVLRRGELVQYDEPCALLSRPADDFVRELLNADDRVRQLGLIRVEAVMRPLPPDFRPGVLPALESSADLRTALSLLLQPGVQALEITREGRPAGVLDFEDLRSRTCQPLQ